MRYRLLRAIPVGLVAAAACVAVGPAVAGPQDDPASEQLARMATADILSTADLSRVSDPAGLDMMVQGYVRKLLKTVPPLAERYKDEASIEGLVARVRENVKAHQDERPQAPAADAKPADSTPPADPTPPSGGGLGRPTRIGRGVAGGEKGGSAPAGGAADPAGDSSSQFGSGPLGGITRSVLTNADRDLRAGAGNQAAASDASLRQSKLEGWVDGKTTLTGGTFFERLAQQVKASGKPDMTIPETLNDADRTAIKALIPPIVKADSDVVAIPDKTGPFFKDHPDWLNDAKALLSRADRALASLLFSDASGLEFKTKAEKRVELLRDWVQGKNRFSKDRYFLETFLTKKAGSKVTELHPDDLAALDSVIRDIARATDTTQPAPSGTAAGRPAAAGLGSALGTVAGAAASSFLESSGVSTIATLADDVIELVESPGFGRAFGHCFAGSRARGLRSLRGERYILVDP